MAEEVVLHVAIRYKPDEAKDVYVKLYPEVVSGDVLIEGNISNTTQFSEESAMISSAEETTLTDVIKTLVDSINRRGYENIFSTEEGLLNDNPLLKRGQIAFESDTKKFKVGDGETRYNDLPLFN